MKKIISILLMLSMAFSLVACSTETASDVVDNDNADVSGEVLDGVDVSNVNTDNLSIFGMDREDLTVEQLETYNALIDILWVSSFMKEEGMEDANDYFGTTLDFQEDGIVVIVEDGVTKNGTWTAEWGTILHNGEEVERAKIDVSFDDNTYRMLLKPNDYDNVPFYNDELEMWFDDSEDVDLLGIESENFIDYNEILAGLVYSEQDLPLDGSPIDVYEFFEDGKMMRQINGVWEEGTWSASRLSQNNIYITMTFGDELLDTEYLTDRKNEMYINDIFVLQPYNLSDVIWMLEEITYADGTTELFVFDNNFGITQSVEAEKLYNTAIHFKTGTDGNFIDKIRDRSAINDASRWRAGTIYTESELEKIINSFVSDVDFSEIPIYDFQILLGTEEFDFNITSDFFSQFNSDGRNTATAQIINGDGMNSDTPYGAYILITTDSTEFLFGFDGYKRPNDAIEYSGADG